MFAQPGNIRHFCGYNKAHLSEVHFKMVSMHSEKPICAPRSLRSFPKVTKLKTSSSYLPYTSKVTLGILGQSIGQACKDHSFSSSDFVVVLGAGVMVAGGGVHILQCLYTVGVIEKEEEEKG